MKIYGIADIHLLSRRNIKKMDNVILKRMKDFLENKAENGSLIIISGDLFDVPVINSFKNYDCLNQLITLFNKMANEKGLRFVIIRGNHDYYHDVENNTDIGMITILENICSSYYSDKETIFVKNISELPPVFVSSSIRNIVISNEDTRLCLLPYDSFDQNTFIKSFENKNQILICHGTIEGEIDDKYNSSIPNIIVEKFDCVFKGHIHKRYHTGKVFSSGSFVKLFSDDESGYIEFDTERSITGLKPFNDKFEIKYISGVFDKENINQILEKLDEYTIASIFFKGSPDDIDIDLFNKCFNTCLDFKIIFESNFTNRIAEIDAGSDEIFVSLDKYLKDNLDKNTFKYLENLRKELNGIET